MDDHRKPTRRGIATCMTLDPVADELLRDMAGGAKTMGRFVSQLVLAEHSRREERARLKALLLAALDEPVRSNA